MISKEEKNDIIDKMKDIKFHNNNQHTKKIMGLLGINNNNINNNSNNIAQILFQINIITQLIIFIIFISVLLL